MDRFARFFCDPVKVVKLIASLLFGVFIIVYVYFQVIGGFDNEIVTESSMLISLNDGIECDACVFRDETVIDVGGSGVVVTLVDEGQRVSKGHVVANIFPTENDALLQDELDRVNRRIEILENSSVGNQFVISDLQKVYDDISAKIFSISSDMAEGNLSAAVDESEDLLVRLNKRDMIVETQFDYTSELDALKQERSELSSRIASIATPVLASDSAGYFYAEADGYENIFNIGDVESINLDNYDEFLSAKPDESLINSDNIKLVNDIVWYLVCSFDSEEKSKIKVGRRYSVSFPEDGNYEIKMELTKIVSETNSSEALAIFRVNVLPGDFNYKRFQEAEIVIKQLEGLSVPKKALRSVNGIEGVYILVGDVIRFRAVERIGEMDDYYIVSLQTNNVIEIDGETNEEKVIKPLSLYDNIIVSGKDLFDGKIVA